MPVGEVSSDAASHLELGPADDDALTMRRGKGNLQPPRDAATLRSSPNQSSPLAGPPLADGAAVAAAAAAAVNGDATTPPKGRKERAKEERERSLALARKKAEDEKERKRQDKLKREEDKLKREEAKRKEKEDKEAAKVKAKEQKMRARMAADDRIKAKQQQPPKATPPPTAAVVASPATITPRATPAQQLVRANIPASTESVVLPSSAALPQSSGSTVRGSPTPVPAATPTLGRRTSLVALLGRKKEHTSSAPQARQNPIVSSAAPAAPESAPSRRGPLPAASSVSKSKSLGVWGTLRKKLGSAAPAPKPTPAPPVPASTAITHSTSVLPPNEPPVQQLVASQPLAPAPLQDVDPGLQLPASDASHAYDALRPRAVDGDATFELARMTTLPASETGSSIASRVVSRHQSPSNTRPAVSRTSTNLSRHSSPGVPLGRSLSNVDKSLPLLPTV
jgi:hypothetical protein